MKIKLDIVSGFLGAGKTTFIRKLISEGFEKDRIFVLENEFGKVGIDGAILQNSGVIVKELTSGCICCSPLMDFMKTLVAGAEEFKPTRIIIEPTGVAKLSELLDQFMHSDYEALIELNMVVTIVDVKRYKSYMMLRPEFFENQIRAARAIVLSKVDSVSKEELESIIDIIHQLNPGASIIADPWEDLDTHELIKILESTEKSSPSRLFKRASGVKVSMSKIPEDAASAFNTFEAELQGIYSKETLFTLLEKIKLEDNYGIILRAKGIVKAMDSKMYKFDYVSGDVKIEDFNGTAAAGVCFIGINLRKEALTELLCSTS